jgi:ABC-type dipeptide/oligopeptide/nickel transport system permease subunit
VRRPTVAPAIVVAVVLAMVIAPAPFAALFGHGDPYACDLARSDRGPSWGHPFGFDVQGCDLYANVIYGARPTVTIGLLVTAGILLVAVVLGGAAGYLGGVTDAVVGRLADVVLGFPLILGALVVLTVTPDRNVLTVSGVLVAFGWPAMTRLMRSTVLGAAGRDYVLAARTHGASAFRIVARHVLPNAISPLLVYATTAVGGVMVAETTLTFLGVGLQAPEISWGIQLADAQQQFLQHPHLLIAPGAFLSVTVISFVALGDTLRSALDPWGPRPPGH